MWTDSTSHLEELGEQQTIQELDNMHVRKCDTLNWYNHLAKEHQCCNDEQLTNYNLSSMSSWIQVLDNCKE